MAAPESAGAAHEWQRLSDSALLDLRLCDLKLKLEHTALYPRVQRLYSELEQVGILFRPHVWLSEEWFSPDGVPGIAAPFYLAHKRLMKLERAQMLECEGDTEAECMRILRHEAGHALDNAYDLRERDDWRTAFGDFHAPYPEHYHPAPASRHYVVHLNAWYAQAHPAEDFAETFAVWLATPPAKWRRQYARWPALAKLEAVESMMSAVRQTEPPNFIRKKVEVLSRCRRTLREHYERKRTFYEVGVPSHYDADLLRLFSTPASPKSKQPSAAHFLAQLRRGLCNAVSETTGVHHYTVDQLLKRMIARARQLRLVLVHSEEATRAEFASLLTTQVLHVAEHGHARIPL